MKQLAKALVTLAVIWGVGYLVTLVYSGYQLQNVDKTTAGFEYTKQEYLDIVRDNGGDEAQVCAYSKMIDQYGTNEVLKMDLRVVADENDVDPRIYPALQECI